MILIIGGKGFIGLNTALRLLEVGKWVVISRHSARRVHDVVKGEIGMRVMVAQMDVTNPHSVGSVGSSSTFRRRAPDPWVPSSSRNLPDSDVERRRSRCPSRPLAAVSG